MGLIENLERIKELVESGAGGGGSDKWEMDAVGYLFHNGQNQRKFDELLAHFPSQTKSLSYTFYNSGWMTEVQLKKVLSLDLTELTSLSYAFYSGGTSCNVDTTYYINIPKCTSMANAFYSFNTPLANLDFNGTTGNVVDYNATFNSCKIKGILNINMDKISNNYSFFNSSSFNRLTFKGTFGGNAATPSLTLNLSQLNSNANYNKDAFIETITSLSPNESGKTRIIKIKATIYDTLSEEEIAIATGKGYTIST
jgi:hypothetical protein